MRWPPKAQAVFNRLHLKRGAGLCRQADRQTLLIHVEGPHGWPWPSSEKVSQGCSTQYARSSMYWRRLRRGSRGAAERMEWRVIERRLQDGFSSQSGLLQGVLFDYLQWKTFPRQHTIAEQHNNRFRFTPASSWAVELVTPESVRRFKYIQWLTPPCSMS